MIHNYKDIIIKLKNERYPNAKTIFWAGSAAKNQATATSDLDLVIIFEKLENAYREAFIYKDIPIDAFIHDESTIRYFFNEVDKSTFILGLPTMIAEGIELPKETEFGNKLRQNALALLKASPTISFEQLKARRFKITDLLDDLQNPNNQHEQIAIIFELYNQLAEFYLLANGKWIGSGKQLARLLGSYNSEIAKKFSITFSNINDITAITKFTQDVLKPSGGIIWDGFRSESAKEWHVEEEAISKNIILNKPGNEKINKLITNALKEYNQSKIGPYEIIPFNIYMHDNNKKVIGGIIGEFYSQLIRINTVWVDEHYRNQGICTKLFLNIEEYAQNHNYKVIQLFTTDFQAPYFYEKLGFTYIAKIDRVFVGGKTAFLMQKYLDDHDLV